MEINPLLQAITTVTLTSNATILPEIRNWQTGQLLEAIAISQAQNGQVRFQVGSTQFEARVQFPVEPGQKLLLEVIKQADPPILQLAQTDINKNAIVNAALRAVLPKQVPGITPLLSNISFLSSRTAQHGSTLSPEILVLAKTFFNLLPDARRVSTPDGLRQAINNSGVFLENKLTTKGSGSNSSSVQQDLKAGLLKLRQAIQTLSQHQTSSKTETTQTGSQKTTTSVLDRLVTDKLVSNIPYTTKSPVSRSPASYASTSKPVLTSAVTGNLATGKPLASTSATNMPVTNNTQGNPPASGTFNISSHLTSRLVYGTTRPGKPATNNPVAGNSTTDNTTQNRPLTNKSAINRAFTFTFVTNNSISSSLLANRLLLNKSVINYLVVRNQQNGKTPEQTISNSGEKTSTDKQQVISPPDTRTNIQKALEIAKNVSDQGRDTANTIRNTLGAPPRVASGYGPASGTSNIPGISAFFRANNPGNNLQPGHEELLKALSNTEELSYLQTRKGLPLAQSRAQPTVNQTSSIDQLITTLLKDVESSLARVQFHQLNSQQPQDTDAKQVWAMEIPVRKENGADVFHLHVEKDTQQSTGTESENRSAWTVRLSFSLEGLGAVHSRISLSGDKISTVFWLEEKHTTALFQKHLIELQENLTRAGINIEKLNCLNGSPPEAERYFFPQQLLHEKA